MTDENEKRLLVAMGQPDLPGEPKVVILGMTKAGWDLMASGQTHTVDLRHLGVDAQVMIFRGDDQAHLVEQLRSTAQELDVPVGKLKNVGVRRPTEH